MPSYPTAQALLSDVRLRLDASGEESSALVVEGNDDHRLFYAWITATTHVVPAGGKRLLHSSLQSIREEDKGRILFFTDCDYDVPAGTLHGGPDVVITTTCDVESDLIGLGVLERLVVEVVPMEQIPAKRSADAIGADVREHAVRAALPVGRVRMAAQPLGVDLGFDELELTKYWDKKADAFLLEKFQRIVWDRLKKNSNISREDWENRLNEVPDGTIVCHGKDLINAAQMFFRVLYKMDHKITADMLMMMMRLAVDETLREKWAVVRRIRQWEIRNGRLILAPAAASKLDEPSMQVSPVQG